MWCGWRALMLGSALCIFDVEVAIFVDLVAAIDNSIESRQQWESKKISGKRSVLEAYKYRLIFTQLPRIPFFRKIIIFVLPRGRLWHGQKWPANKQPIKKREKLKTHALTRESLQATCVFYEKKVAQVRGRDCRVMVKNCSGDFLYAGSLVISPGICIRKNNAYVSEAAWNRGEIDIHKIVFLHSKSKVFWAKIWKKKQKKRVMHNQTRCLPAKLSDIYKHVLSITPFKSQYRWR